MPLERHSLVNEFPEMRDRIHELKMHNHEFAKLFTEYDNVEHTVHRIEAGNQATSDNYLEDLKVLRVILKDKLYEMLKKTV